MKIRWEYAVASSFGLFILGIVGFVLFTLGDRNDLVQDRYYDAEIQYQRQIDKVSRSESSNAEAVIDSTAEGLLIRFPSQYTAHDIAGTVHLYRPDDKRLDLIVPIGTDSTLTQLMPSALLRPGRWKIKVQWTGKGTEYYAERGIFMSGN